jgi:hypothetical protein
MTHDHEERIAELERRADVMFEMISEGAEALKLVKELLLEIRAAVIEQHEANTK